MRAGRSCAGPTRCGSCRRKRRSCTSGATRTASPTRRSAPTRRASISSSAATRPSSTSSATRATTSRSPARSGASSTRSPREFDAPGRFVCIPGYEWSANTAVGGDRNVHYRHEGETIHRSSHAQIADAADIGDEKSDAHTAHELFQKLKGKDCVVVAHVGGRYADIKFAHDPMETAVEVHSAWGTFEWIAARCLREELPRRHRRQLGRAQGPARRLLSRRLVLRQLRRAHLLPGRAARSRRHLRVDAPPPPLCHDGQPRFPERDGGACQRGRGVPARSRGRSDARGALATADDGRHRPRCRRRGRACRRGGGLGVRSNGSTSSTGWS